MANKPGDFFLNKFGVSIESSGKIASWMPAATAVMTPLIGMFIDSLNLSPGTLPNGNIHYRLYMVGMLDGIENKEEAIRMIVLGSYGD